MPFGWELGLVTNNVLQQEPEFDLQNSKAGAGAVCLLSSAGEADAGRSWVLWSASLARLASSRSVRDSVSPEVDES